MTPNDEAPSTIGQPEDAIVLPLDDLIDPDTYTPRLITLLANAIIGRESYELRRAFGLGTNEWRLISALARRPGSPASELSNMLYVNKAIVSRTVRLLESRKLITLPRGPLRSRPIYLTRAGADMYHRMRPISSHGQDIILAGLSPEQVAEVNAQLTRMLEALRGADFYFASH
jgi:DNA-binding MarR family transcriptional regulator